ncbi:hypothetical protein [Streptomyces sp. CA-132043]|uniref:hypothetical protein n=1 Tax=Streptomyces sp. CA-132043 TaxID=3240048 RepID=UPI003D905A07
MQQIASTSRRREADEEVGEVEDIDDVGEVEQVEKVDDVEELGEVVLTASIVGRPRGRCRRSNRYLPIPWRYGD